MVDNSLNWEQESTDIYNEISKIFATDSVTEIVNPAETNAYQKIEQLLNKLEIAQHNKSQRGNLTSVMKTAYLTIMKVRTLLLGDPNTIISYRFYITSNKDKSVKVVDIPENQLMNFIRRDRDNLRLKKNLDSLLENSKNVQRNYEAERLLERHQVSIMKSLKQVTNNTTNYIVPKSRLSDLGNYNTIKTKGNLYWQELQGDVGKSAYTPKIFNRGWIMQAFDQTFEDLYWSKNREITNPISETLFRKYFFFENLAYDKVSGFKGGDVANRQIKSNLADLVSITHLIKYLTILKDILSGNIKDKTTLTCIIANNFSSTGDLSDPINKNIENVVDQLLRSFSQNKNLTIN